MQHISIQENSISNFHVSYNNIFYTKTLQENSIMKFEIKF